MTITTQMKYGLIFLLFLLVMPLVIAVTIEETNIDVRVYNTTPILTNGNLTTIKIDINSSVYSSNNKVLSFSVNLSNGLEIDIDFPFLFIKNESVDTTTVNQLITCLKEKSTCEIEKGKFDISWNKCVQDLNKYEGENTTLLGEDLDECSLLLKGKELELGAKNGEIQTLKDNEDNTKNSKYFWGIFGVVLGIVGLLFYQGKIGGSTARDKSMGEFNKMGAG